MTEAIITVKNAQKNFGDVKALRGINLEVKKGEILGLLGPNGAGKTTLVRALTTLMPLDQGEALVSGINVSDQPEIVRNHIGLAGQFAAIDENLTGKENLELVGKLYHLPNSIIKERVKDLLSKFSLTDAANRVAKNYSGGMRRRLDLAASLMGEPEILFLDEPTTGLDPRSRNELWEVIKELVDGGTTVLLTTQYLEEADFLADRIILIDHGKVIAEGTARELKSQIGGAVIEIHLAQKSDLEKAIKAIESVGKPEIDHITNHLTITTDNGAKALFEIMRLLDTEKIEVADVELRKPSLDEVFLKLTGQKEESHE